MKRLLLSLWLVVAGTVAHAAIDIQEVTSPGGIKAWLVQEPSIPFVALEIRIRGGASLDLPGKRGATNLMMALIEEGAGDMDARAFQAARESLAASFRFRAGDDLVSISAEVLTENRPEAMALLREALLNPRFDPDAIDRVRAQVLSGLASDAKDPETIAGDTFGALAFGDHPYGTVMDGTPDSVNALTRDDLLTAHRNAFVRSRIYVGASGDISAEELGALLDDLFAGLPEDGPPLPADVPFGLTGGVTVVPFDTPQSVAFFAQPGIARDDPDYMAAYIMNEVLGASGFESRLMNEVREKRGLTYGIRTSLVPRFHTAYVFGSVASSNATIAQAIEVTKDEWARMAAEGLSAEELDRIKTFLTGAYPLRFDGNAEIADILVGMQITGLPPDYVANRNDQVNAVTLEEVNRVAADLLDATALHFVVVGQPEGLEATPQ